MKKTKIIISVLLTLVMCLPLFACGGGNDINVTVKIAHDDHGVISEGSVALSAKEATVLKAISEYCDANEFPYNYNDALDSIMDIGNYAETELNKFSYFWVYTVNDKELVGRANENYLADGDVVTYTYTSVPMGEYVTVKFVAEGKDILEQIVVFDEGDTVIDAAVDALDMNEIDNAVSDDGLTLELVKRYQAKVTPAYDEVWEFTVNGKAATAAAGETPAVNENVIVFEFVHTDKEVAE